MHRFPAVPRRHLTASLAMLATLLALATAHAATFTVTKTTDTDDGTCDADCSLREAVIAANAAAGADDITLPAGTYTLSIAGQAEEGAATGDLDITDALTINGAGEATTIIDGAGIDRVLDVKGATVVVNDLTVQGGFPQGNLGGGIRSAGDLTLNRVTVQGNTARYGAGIHNGLYHISDSNAPDGPTYDFVDISTTGTELSPLDSETVQIRQTLAFPFSYYGHTFNEVYVYGHGALGMMTGIRNVDREDPMPDDGDPLNLIAPFRVSGVFIFVLAGQVFTETLGSAPNRRFVVQFNNVEVGDVNSGNTPGPMTYQIILEEGSNDILFQYQTVPAHSIGQGGFSTVGIIGPEDRVGAAIYSYQQQVLRDGLAVRFRPGAGNLVMDSVTVDANVVDSSPIQRPSGPSGDVAYDNDGIGLFNNGTASITDSTFSNNVGEDAITPQLGSNGGGIGNHGGTVTLTGSTVTGNNAGQNGGGIVNRYGTMTLDGTTVSGNIVYCRDEPNGGGIANIHGHLVIRNNSQITGNFLDPGTCDASGGGIFSLFGEVSISDSAVTDNEIDDADESNSAGGALMAIHSRVVITNSEISGNTTSPGRSPSTFSGSTGGGLDGVKSEFIIDGVDIASNTNPTLSPTDEDDSVGGGMRAFQSLLTIRNSQVTGNTVTNAAGGGIAFVGVPSYTALGNRLPDGPTFAFEDISGTGIPLGLGIDGVSAPRALGFQFPYWGVVQNSVQVNADGYLMFSNGNAEIYEDSFLDPTTGEIYIETRGSAPNRRFIVQFDNVSFETSPLDGTMTFQAILYEGSGEILMQYADIQQTDRTADDGEIALFGTPSGSVFSEDLRYLQGSGGVRLTDGFAVRFRPTGMFMGESVAITGNTAGDVGGGFYTNTLLSVLLDCVSVTGNTNTANTGDDDISDVNGVVTTIACEPLIFMDGFESASL